MNSDLAIQVVSLSKRYEPVLAVDHVSFEVRKGEFLGFLGPNGAGKTATVRILTGVIKAESGTAQIAGFGADSLKARQLI